MDKLIKYTYITYNDGILSNNTVKYSVRFSDHFCILHFDKTVEELKRSRKFSTLNHEDAVDCVIHLRIMDACNDVG